MLNNSPHLLFFPDPASLLMLSALADPAGFEVKDHAQKQEATSSLPAPPQLPLPEIPQPWLVSVRHGAIIPECVSRARRAMG